MNRRGWFSSISVVLAVVVAAATAVIAVDVLRSSGRMAGDDSGFNASMQTGEQPQGSLWSGIPVLPDWLTVSALEIEDDLAYRRTLARFAELRPGHKEQVTDLEREDLWTALHFDLTTRSREETNLTRRSALQNLLGVLTLARYAYVAPEERVQVITNALGSFRSAIELDQENDDAKLNLELVLRLFGPAPFLAEGPGGGAASGQISGQGRTGSGY